MSAIRDGKLRVKVRVRAPRVGQHGVYGLALEVRGAPGMFEVPLTFANPSGLEVVPQTDPVLREGALALGIDRLLGSRTPPRILLQRLEDQTEGVAKRVSIAPSASAALDGKAAFEASFDQDALADALGRDLEPEGLLESRLPGWILRAGPGGPPAGRRLELEALRPVREAIDQDLEVGHRRIRHPLGAGPSFRHALRGAARGRFSGGAARRGARAGVCQRK